VKIAMVAKPTGDSSKASSVDKKADMVRELAWKVGRRCQRHAILPRACCRPVLGNRDACLRRSLIHASFFAIAHSVDSSVPPATMASMRLDLTNLQLFLHIRDAGSITGGAQRSHMTLASASERIRSLEAALGEPLLIRNRRGVSETPAGRTLAHHARLVTQQIEHLKGELGQYGKGVRGHVRLRANAAAVSEHLPEVLADFLVTHPLVSLDVHEHTSADIAHGVRTGMCDIGMASDAADLQGLVAMPFKADQLVLIVPKDHPLAARTAMSFTEVLDEPFIGQAEQGAMAALLTHHASLAGKTLAYRVRLDSMDAICRMVGRGAGVAVVPAAAARRGSSGSGRAGIRRVRLTDAWTRRQVMLCVRDPDQLPLPARQLLDHLLAHAG
jgi:DNA-binding transcriptional LysR family regulator